MLEMHGSVDHLGEADGGVLGSAVTGVDLSDLPRGTELLVETRNSQYRLVLLDDRGRNALIEGGRHFREWTEVQINGSMCGESLPRVGWIGLGLSLELTVHGMRLLTSRVRSIRIEPSPP